MASASGFSVGSYTKYKKATAYFLDWLLQTRGDSTNAKPTLCIRQLCGPKTAKTTEIPDQMATHSLVLKSYRKMTKNRDAYLQHLADLQADSFRRSINKQQDQEREMGLSKVAKPSPASSANTAKGSDGIETCTSAWQEKNEKKKRGRKARV